MEQLKSFHIIAHLRHLQEEIYEVKTWSNRITEKQDILKNNLTTLSQDVTKVDQSTTSMAKDVGLKITTIKTDIRRISGLVTDVTSLTDSVQELEKKIEKVEKNTVKNIGDLLSSSIDRTAMLRKTASTSRFSPYLLCSIYSVNPSFFFRDSGISGGGGRGSLK